MVALRVGFPPCAFAAALLAVSWAVCTVNDQDNSAFAQSASKPSATAATPSSTVGGAVRQARCPDLLDRTLARLQDDAPQHLCQYAGRAVLVVNTASHCGFTQQYEGLEALFRRYRDRGFVVLGFPSNDFGGQEPGTSEQIATFCKTKFGVKFPMFEKVATKGPGQSPVYTLLAKQDGGPKWNFHKYLVGKDGKIIAAFPSSVKPDSPELRKAIDAALAG